MRLSLLCITMTVGLAACSTADSGSSSSNATDGEAGTRSAGSGGSGGAGGGGGAASSAATTASSTSSATTVSSGTGTSDPVCSAVICDATSFVCDGNMHGPNFTCGPSGCLPWYDHEEQIRCILTQLSLGATGVFEFGTDMHEQYSDTDIVWVFGDVATVQRCNLDDYDHDLDPRSSVVMPPVETFAACATGPADALYGCLVAIREQPLAAAPADCPPFELY
jgi:hypothetical protein